MQMWDRGRRLGFEAMADSICPCSGRLGKQATYFGHSRQTNSSISWKTRGLRIEKEVHMKHHGVCSLIVISSFSLCLLISGLCFAQREKGPSTEAISGAYKQMLAGADKNGDGKLSMEECLAVSKDKKKMEKNCRYWDANGDGFITEDEYVGQAKKAMR